mgnify:CR=1 FL=1
MAKPVVYLAGRISELTWEEASTWRTLAADLLGDSFQIRNPMRDKPELKTVGKLTGAYPEYLLCQAKAIVLRDLTDLDHADAVLVYAPPGCHPGKATWMEIGYTVKSAKPIVLVADRFDDELRTNPFLSALPRLLIVGTLTEAAQVLRSLFNV